MSLNPTAPPSYEESLHSDSQYIVHAPGGPTIIPEYNSGNHGTIDGNSDKDIKINKDIKIDKDITKDEIKDTSNKESITNKTDKKDKKLEFDKRMSKFQSMVKKYLISAYFANKLRVLENYKIVYIIDDSGSMSQQLNDTYDNENKNTNAYGHKKTRWQEAYEIVLTTLDISLCLSEDGIDIHFLNRDSIYAVKDKEIIDVAFSVDPEGGTPLVDTLVRVLKNIKSILLEKKVLIIIVTDGEPRNSSGGSDVHKFKSLLMNRCSYASFETEVEGIASSASSTMSYNRLPVSILACTDDEESVNYLNKLDDEVPSLDVVDDYITERRQILNAQGSRFTFSHGDYVVKCLIGAIDPEIDKLDEKKSKCTIL